MTTRQARTHRNDTTLRGRVKLFGQLLGEVVWEHAGEEVLAVLEMPVETAFRDVQALGQHLDADTRHPLVGEGVEGGLNPCGAVELGTGYFFHTL